MILGKQYFSQLIDKLFEIILKASNFSCIKRLHVSFSVLKKLFAAFTYHFTKKKITFVRWQLDLFGLTLLVIGFFLGSAISWNFIIPRIFAATSWTQTDWSGGSGTSTTNQYSAISNVDTTTTAGQATLTQTSGWASSYTSWPKRQPVTITNTGSAQTDYQVKLTVAYNSAMQADFSDLRFTNSSGTVLNYWIQDKTNSSTATVWVKVDSLAATGDTTIYMYYGNSTASAGSNGTNTFMFFDDFNSGSLDLTKWSKADSGTLYSISGGELIIGPGNNSWNQALYTTQSFARSDISMDMKYRWTSNNTSYDAMMMGWKDDGTGASYTNMVYGYYNSGNGTCSSACAVNVYEDGNSRSPITGSWTENTQYMVRVRMRASGGAYYEQSTDNGATWTTSYTSSYSTASTLHPGFVVYSGTHAFDDVRIRKWMATEPTSAFGTEVSEYQSTGTLTSNIFDTGVGSDWGILTYTATTPTNTTLSVKVRAGNIADLSDATAFSSCTAVASGVDLSGGCTPDNKRYVQYQVAWTSSDLVSTPTLQDVTIAYSTSDTIPPVTNASAITMATASSGGRSVASNGWNNATGPYFSWTAGADNSGGSGIKGYCLYLGTDSLGDPATAKGVLGTSPVSTTNTTCQFIVSSTSVDLSTSGYLGSALVSGTTYYLNVKAIDNGNNVFTGSSSSFYFQHDSTAPTNVSYLSMPSQNYSNVSDMNFSWPVSGTGVATDSASGVIGWQYQINSSSGTWQGTTHSTTLDMDYIPASASAYTLVPSRDSSAIVSGNNVIYFRTLDAAGNTSSSSTYRTGNLTYGGAAPTFPGDGAVTITPSSATTNSFALSWPAATASGSNTVTHYYYMINTSPPSTLATLQGNSTTYIDNGTSRTISAKALANVNKGSNTVYVVAIDNAGTPNYSPSNDITGTFTLNSTNPDPVQNLVSTDSSIKSTSTWNVTLTWTAGTYQGAGNLTYEVYRSSDDSSFSKVGSTSGLSYVDNTPASQAYYYYVVTQDGANATSSNSSTVTITPTGKFTAPPVLQTSPTVSGITTQQATITWSTDRDGDSKIAYGTSSGSYGTTQPYVSTQVTSHTITLTNLTPGTTYYYKASWTDTDGNTGTSSEASFSTNPPPAASGVKATSISLTSAYITFTVSNATQATIQYGTSTSYGGTTTTSTSTSQSTYSVPLTGLLDGTQYHYRIVMQDASGTNYNSDDYTDLVTLPRPKITGVRIQQVINTAQPTILVSWNTNTQVSSIVTYYPEGNAGGARDEVNIALVKGEHQMIIRSLFAKTNYMLLVKGRDKAGNEATSDIQKVTTATDTRPPQVSGLKVEGSSMSTSNNSSSQLSQLAVSWNTDEPATSKVEFGEGTGSTYSQKTQEDSSLTSNHLVIISGLTPSKVYHLRVVTKDDAGNIGNSIDTVTITPKATDNAFNLVIGSLSQIFGGFGR